MRGKPIGHPVVAGYISEEEQARRCGVHRQTLRRWKARGYGPRPVNFGRFPMYRENANEQFLAQQAAAIEAQRNPRRRGRPAQGAGR